jgi:ubiquinone/menaquinone biosynthesis C-methylase UbiE
MKTRVGIGLKDVQRVYSGEEGDLWELIMGEQIHIGGLTSSMRLAEMAGVGKGLRGIDLCCCSGAGMRFLLRFRDVESMTGVDATVKMIERGRKRTEQEGWGDRIRFCEGNAMETGLPDGEADFVWGEDAWCYVEDKRKLIAEAVRLVKSGGKIAFTDWIETENGMSWGESERFLKFMKFPNVETLEGYRKLLEENGCKVQVCEDTGQFAPHVDLYLEMLSKQLTYDALRIIHFDRGVLEAMSAEMVFMQTLARERKIGQGRVLALKK